MEVGNTGDEFEKNDTDSLLDSEDEDLPDQGNRSEMIEGEADFDKEMDNDDDDDDGDDDDTSDSEDEEIAEAEVKLLEAKLEENPYDYSSHVALINKLQNMGGKSMEKLKNAREVMSSKYPLSSELWLPWIRDEMSFAKSKSERAAVAELCERAIKDYLCKLNS